MAEIRQCQRKSRKSDPIPSKTSASVKPVSIIQPFTQIHPPNSDDDLHPLSSRQLTMTCLHLTRPFTKNALPDANIRQFDGTVVQLIPTGVFN
jgi:hypothetical protein